MTDALPSPPGDPKLPEHPQHPIAFWGNLAMMFPLKTTVHWDGLPPQEVVQIAEYLLGYWHVGIALKPPEVLMKPPKRQYGDRFVSPLNSDGLFAESELMECQPIYELGGLLPFLSGRYARLKAVSWRG